MRSTFWPNRILEPQSFQNREIRLKFFSKRENSALFMKIVQNALFRSCAARFGQIAFWSLKVFKIVTLASNCLQNGKTVRFPWKMVQNALFRSCAARFGQFPFLSVKVLKIVKEASNCLQNGKTVRFLKIVQNALFRSCAARFGQNRICERQSSQNRHSGLKFSLKRENCALSMKIVQNALFRSCGARFGQIAFWSVKVLKIVKEASKSLQHRKTVRFP